MTKQKSVVVGSLGDVTERGEPGALAESFMSAEVIILMDNSGSMGVHDVAGQSRREVADEQLVELQGRHPGAVALVCFADRAEFSPSGNMIPVGSGTDMVSALSFIRCADGLDYKILLITDGEPNQPNATLKLAAKFASKIHAIYCGPEDGRGMDFLNRLMRVTGGSLQKSGIELLAASAERMFLLDTGAEESVIVL